MDHQEQDLPASRAGTALPRSFDANVQLIASAAHLRGVILTRGSAVTGSVEAADLCRTLRAAFEKQRANDGRLDHVKRMTNAIATSLGARGSVQVSQLAWQLLSGYANPKARA